MKKNDKLRHLITGGEIAKEMSPIRKLDDVAQIMGISVGRVEQLEKIALGKIRDAFAVEAGEERK